MERELHPSHYSTFGETYPHVPHGYEV